MLRRAALPALLALGLLVSGCSGSDASPAADDLPDVALSDGPASTASSAEQPSAEPSAAAPSDEPSAAAPESAPPSGSTAYRRFTNVRFAFAVDLPADLVPGEEPDNGDGQAFVSPDGDAEVRAYGSNNIDGQTAQEELETLVSELEADGTVTYQRRKGDGVTVSGTVGDRVVFVRELVSPEVLRFVRWSYPRSATRTYDAAVSRSASTLTALD